MQELMFLAWNSMAVAHFLTYMLQTHTHGRKSPIAHIFNFSLPLLFPLYLILCHFHFFYFYNNNIFSSPTWSLALTLQNASILDVSFKLTASFCIYVFHYYDGRAIQKQTATWNLVLFWIVCFTALHLSRETKPFFFFLHFHDIWTFAV